VNIIADRLSRLAFVTVVVVAASGLAACGRKGQLDPPPGTALTSPSPVAQRPSLGEQGDSLGPSPNQEPRARPQVVAQPGATGSSQPPGPQKSFFLDFLLGK
jgi:predicted small lipoprotein YifL